MWSKSLSPTRLGRVRNEPTASIPGGPHLPGRSPRTGTRPHTSASGSCLEFVAVLRVRWCCGLRQSALRGSALPLLRSASCPNSQQPRTANSPANWEKTAHCRTGRLPRVCVRPACSGVLRIETIRAPRLRGSAVPERELSQLAAAAHRRRRLRTGTRPHTSASGSCLEFVAVARVRGCCGLRQSALRGSAVPLLCGHSKCGI